MSEAAAVALPIQHSAKTSVLVRMAERFGVDPSKLHATLKATAFRGDVSNEQFMALMIVADQYKLNPLTKELYAFPDKNNGIVPVVGVDGWTRIVNEHPSFNGVEFTDGPVKDGLPEWIECSIYRKDRDHPTKVREYMAECKRGTGPWQSHPRRLLRHKSLIQCARLAFGFGGIYDQDEAERIIEGSAVIETESSTSSVADINAEITGAKPSPAAAETARTIDAEPAIDESVTYATVNAAMQKAARKKDGEAFALARDMIRSVADEGQRAELDVEARRLEKQLEAAGAADRG